ncbi:hypothetical protein Hbl1158_11335 [Halobaculum sp. CBA1158]|uniref:hypothetical protein n=1 Tax=Halobaculum sp. CBA1158 TaxID=2904243 RepID=UPI001F38CD1F|nr:hypothetical protein [Halobaculum sp. CBA1158]UIO99123.1 hypothetical protein Hbl1158_11335 [Halobaculum sp. CBA1158]
MGATVPTVPKEALAADGWRERERRETTAFDAKVVTVEAATVVYEDVDLRERVREATGLDRLWRFFVASRLTLSPATPPSRALTSLVADRAQAGFADTLEERGFEGVRRSDPAEEAGTTGAADALGDDSRVASYDALCRLGEVSVRARGWAAVRPAGDAYLLVGGAYPTTVRDAPADPGVGSAIGELLDPDRFRGELFELMRATDG